MPTSFNFSKHLTHPLDGTNSDSSIGQGMIFYIRFKLVLFFCQIQSWILIHHITTISRLQLFTQTMCIPCNVLSIQHKNLYVLVDCGRCQVLSGKEHCKAKIYKAKVPLLHLGTLAWKLIKSKREDGRLSIWKGVGLICLLVNHLWRSSWESLILISHSQIDACVIFYQKEFLERLKREPRNMWDAITSKSDREPLIFTALINYNPKDPPNRFFEAGVKGNEIVKILIIAHSS